MEFYKDEHDTQNKQSKFPFVWEAFPPDCYDDSQSLSSADTGPWPSQACSRAQGDVDLRDEGVMERLLEDDP